MGHLLWKSQRPFKLMMSKPRLQHTGTMPSPSLLSETQESLLSLPSPRSVHHQLLSLHSLKILQTRVCPPQLHAPQCVVRCLHVFLPCLIQYHTCCSGPWPRGLCPGLSHLLTFPVLFPSGLPFFEYSLPHPLLVLTHPLYLHSKITPEDKLSLTCQIRSGLKLPILHGALSSLQNTDFGF